MMNREDHLTFIVKLTSDCNFDCDYCDYGYEDRHSPSGCARGVEKHFLTPPRMRIIFKRIYEGLERLNICGGLKLHFIWHGGEPFLFSPQWFQKIAKHSQEIFEAKKYSLVHSIQTNGAIPLKRYIPALQGGGFRVGVSYDYRSTLRHDYNKKRQSKIIWQNIALLRRHGLLLGIINVISKQNIKYPKEMYRFYKKRGLSFMANRLKVCNPKTERYAISAKEYGNFLVSLARCWLNDRSRPHIFITTIHQFMKRLLRNYPVVCWQYGNCAYNYVLIRENGTVSACGSSQIIGNLLEQPLDQILMHPHRLSLFKRKKIIACKSKNKKCKWINYCWGGCPETSGDYFSCSTDCEAIKALYSYLDKHRPLMNRWYAFVSR